MSATNRNDKNRNPFDFYPTPDEPIDKILKEIDFAKIETFIEPCLGTGVIYNKIPKHIKKNYAEIQKGKDYLEMSFKSDIQITNPPFSMALDFLEKSLSEADTVVYLLRLNFLGSQKRKPFWQKNPPSHVFVLSKRPSFTGKGTDATEYAWFVWDRKNVVKKPNGIYVI